MDESESMYVSEFAPAHEFFFNFSHDVFLGGVLAHAHLLSVLLRLELHVQVLRLHLELIVCVGFQPLANCLS